VQIDPSSLRADPFQQLPVEFTHRPGAAITGADTYAPTLRIRRCQICGNAVLRVCFSHRAIWAETREAKLPWVRIGIPLGDFLRLTRCSRPHACT